MNEWPMHHCERNYFTQLSSKHCIRETENENQTNECQHINPKSHRIEINSHDKRHSTFLIPYLVQCSLRVCKSPAANHDCISLQCELSKSNEKIHPLLLISEFAVQEKKIEADCHLLYLVALYLIIE